MKLQLLAAAALLAGCVTTSDVVSIGNGQYMLTGHASGGMNAGKGTAAAVKKASDYCAGLGRTLLVDTNDMHGMAAVGCESTNLVFKCEPPAS